MILSFLSSFISSGMAFKQLLDKSRISKVSANDKISVGNTLRFSDKLKREIPAKEPDFSAESVCKIKSP